MSGTRCSQLLLLSLTVAFAACTTTEQRNDLRGQVRECADPDSVACAEAREGFQRVRYPTMTVDRLVAASSRALGDLNFEPERDDAQRQVSGRYIATAPVHDKQLDELFRKTVKTYAPSLDALRLTAQVEVAALPDRDTGGGVRLRLFLAGEGGMPRPVDSVAPYQIFFRQLGVELGAAPTPVEEDEDKRKQRRPMAPSISGV